MASVAPHRVRHCSTHKGLPQTNLPEGCRRCKATAWRTFWANPEGKGRSEVFDGAKMENPHGAAKAKKAEVEKALRDGTYIDPAAPKTLYMTFLDEWAAAQDWKASYRINVWPSIRKRHESYVGEKTTLGSIDRLRLLSIRQDLVNKPYAGNKCYARNTIQTTMYQIKAVLRSAAANGRVPRDPTVDVKAAPKRRADDPTRRVTPEMVPTSEEAWSILNAAPDEWKAAHAFGLAAERISEMLGMERECVNRDTGEITVRQQAVAIKGMGVVLTTTKAENVRTIQPADDVFAIILAHLDAGHGGVWVDAQGVEHNMLFLDGKGRLFRHGAFYDVAYTPALEKAGLVGRFTFHGYRHHVASLLLAEGADIASVAGYIGDHPHTVMRVYAHWLRDKKHVPPDILNRLYAQMPRNLSPIRHAA